MKSIFTFNFVLTFSQYYTNLYAKDLEQHFDVIKHNNLTYGFLASLYRHTKNAECKVTKGDSVADPCTICSYTHTCSVHCGIGHVQEHKPANQPVDL